MTRLSRKVRRVVQTKLGRDLVVTIIPAAQPMIEVREKGRRAGFSITIGALYGLLAMRAADALVAERRKRRALRRVGR